VRSVLSDEKKLSIAALSQTLPDRLIEQTTPLSAMSLQKRVGLAPSPNRHHQRIGDELRRQKQFTVLPTAVHE
jgi:hypothetical protein